MNATPARAEGWRNRRIFEPQLLFLLGLLLALMALAHWRGGSALLSAGFGEGVGLLLRFGLLIVVSFLAAGFISTLLPQGLVEQSLGREAGLRGIALATFAGAITPSGPFVSMPIALTLLRSGAAPGPVIAFLVAWSLLSVHRLLAWELPILGPRFALLRYALSLLLALAAGLLVHGVGRWLARSAV